MGQFQSTDTISKKITINDEDGEMIASLTVSVEFGDLLEDSKVEKIADFFDISRKTFSLMME